MDAAHGPLWELRGELCLKIVKLARGPWWELRGELYLKIVKLARDAVHSVEYKKVSKNIASQRPTRRSTL
jgi:hypothetical protein